MTIDVDNIREGKARERLMNLNKGKIKDTGQVQLGNKYKITESTKREQKLWKWRVENEFSNE